MLKEVIDMKLKKKLKESSVDIDRVRQDVADWLYSRVEYEFDNFYSDLTGQLPVQEIESNFPNYNSDWCADEFDSLAYDEFKGKIVDAIVEDMIFTLFEDAPDSDFDLPDPYDLALQYFDMSYTGKEARADLLKQQYDYDYIQDVLGYLNDIYENSDNY